MLLWNDDGTMLLWIVEVSLKKKDWRVSMLKSETYLVRYKKLSQNIKTPMLVFDFSSMIDWNLIK